MSTTSAIGNTIESSLGGSGDADSANIATQINDINNYSNNLGKANAETQNEYASEARRANNVGMVDQPNFGDMDSDMGSLSALAGAFQQMFQQGSPVAAAQNAIQRGQDTRAALAPGATPDQVINRGQESGAAQVQNMSQQTAQMGQVANQAQGFSAAAKLQQQALQAQVIHANAQATMRKKQIATQAQLSAASSLEAQQEMINDANASMATMALGGQVTDFNNMMQGVQTVAGGLQQAASVGSSLLKSNSSSNSPSLNNVSTGQYADIQNNNADSGSSSFGDSSDNANYTGPDSEGSAGILTGEGDTGDY